MIVNILVYLVVIALTVGAGWLTWRAVRAKRPGVKIAGGLGAGFLTLAFAAVTFMGGLGTAMLYFPGAAPAPEIKVEGTPEQIARGEYLANIGCVECHSPDGALPLSGRGHLRRGHRPAHGALLCQRPPRSPVRILPRTHRPRARNPQPDRAAHEQPRYCRAPFAQREDRPQPRLQHLRQTSSGRPGAGDSTGERGGVEVGPSFSCHPRFSPFVLNYGCPNPRAAGVNFVEGAG